MFGTVARLKVKPGHEQAVEELFDAWKRDHRPKAEGARTGYLYRSESEPDVNLMVIGFEDRNSYRDNAQEPRQHEWYQQVREHLVEDPHWQDGEIVNFWHP